MNVDQLFDEFNTKKRKNIDNVNNNNNYQRIERGDTKRHVSSSNNNNFLNKQPETELNNDLKSETKIESQISNDNDVIQTFESIFAGSDFKVTDELKSEAIQLCKVEASKNGDNSLDPQAYNSWCNKLTLHLWCTYLTNIRIHATLKTMKADYTTSNLKDDLKKRKDKFLIQELLPNEELLYDLIMRVDNIKNFETIEPASQKNSHQSDLFSFYNNLLNSKMNSSLAFRLRHGLFDLLMAIFEEHGNTDIKYLILQKFHLMISDFHNSEGEQLKSWQVLIFDKFFKMKAPQRINKVYGELKISLSDDKISENKNEVVDFKILIGEFYTSLLNFSNNEENFEGVIIGNLNDKTEQINAMNEWFLKLQVFNFEHVDEANDNDDTDVWYEYFDSMFNKIVTINDELIMMNVINHLNEKVDQFESFLEFLIVKFSTFKNPKRLQGVLSNENSNILESLQSLTSLIFTLLDNYPFLKFEFVDRLQGLQLIMIYLKKYYNKDNFKHIVDQKPKDAEPLEEFDSTEWQDCLKFILPILFQLLCIVLSRDKVNGNQKPDTTIKKDFEKLGEENLRILSYCTESIQCGILKYLFKPLNDIIIVTANDEDLDNDVNNDIIKEMLCVVLFPLDFVFLKSLESTKRFDVLQFYEYWISIIVSLLNNLQFDSEERIRLKKKLFEKDQKSKAASSFTYYEKLSMIKNFINDKMEKKYRTRHSKSLDEEIKSFTEMQDYVISDSYLFKIDYGYDIVKLITLIQSWYLVDCEIENENDADKHSRLLDLQQFKAELIVSSSGTQYLDVINEFLA